MKTDETKRIETKLFKYLDKNGQFSITECTLGFGVGGRVDCISIDSKDNIRCFEIKITKSDFHSKHGHNFSGNLNYYVMPNKLYEEVKEEIPANIGVYDSSINCVKRAKRISIDNLDRIKDYMIRSLYREYANNIFSNNITLLKRLRSDSAKYKTKYDKLDIKYNSLIGKLYLELGREKYREFMEDV